MHKPLGDSWFFHKGEVLACSKWNTTMCVSCERTLEAWPLPSREKKVWKMQKDPHPLKQQSTEMLSSETIILITGATCGPSDTFRRFLATPGMGQAVASQGQRGEQGVPEVWVSWAQLESVDKIPASMGNSPHSGVRQWYIQKDDCMGLKWSTECPQSFLSHQKS